MLFYSACAAALIFMGCGMLIYRLGVSDGMRLKKNSPSGGLFTKNEQNKSEVVDWQSIIAYDPKK